jgi:hypothetical protein
MAALSTAIQAIGINGVKLTASGGLVTMSTATTSCTFTCSDLSKVAIFAFNPSGATDQTVTINAASTAGRYIARGQGALVLTTALGSSDYLFAGNLESARFGTTNKSFVITATTTILIAAIELSSTRGN